MLHADQKQANAPTTTIHSYSDALLGEIIMECLIQLLPEGGR